MTTTITADQARFLTAAESIVKHAVRVVGSAEYDDVAAYEQLLTTMATQIADALKMPH